jgi:hypothetical protein
VPKELTFVNARNWMDSAWNRRKTPRSVILDPDHE